MKNFDIFLSESARLDESSSNEKLGFLISAYNPKINGSRTDFVNVAMREIGVTKSAAERFWTSNKDQTTPNTDYKAGMHVTLEYGSQMAKFNEKGGRRPQPPVWSGTITTPERTVTVNAPKLKRSDMFNGPTELNKEGARILLQAFNPAIRGAKAEFVKHIVMYGRTEQFADLFWKDNAKKVTPNIDYKLGMDVTIDYAIDVAHYNNVGGPRPTKPTRPDTLLKTSAQTPSVAGVTSSDKQKSGIIRYQARREDENATYTITYNPEKKLVIAKNDLGVQISLGNFHKDRRLGTEGTTRAIRAAVVSGLDALNRESLSLYKWKKI